MNTLANSFGVNALMLGRNAIGGFTIIIERLRPTFRIVLETWSHYFLAAIYGCNAGLFRETLHEVYIPRIQRGDASFAANVLGVRGALLSVLVHFFENWRWESPVETGREEQSLTADDHVFILAEAAINLTVTRGMGALEARICYERVESLCRSVNRPALLYSALIGQVALLPDD